MMYYGSVAPVVVKDKLIIGPSGDDLDVPAYLEARSPENGDLIWRWYVTPQKEGDPGLDTWPNLDMAKHGGGMAWQPITYDPALNHIYVTTGNPQPVVAFKNREGANLYTASIVALDADTGKMVWHFQSSPHDTHDWDATQTAVLFDGTVDGQPRKLLAQASRNGHFFVLDRTTGKALVSSDYNKTNWSLGYDAKGQPKQNPDKRPQVAGALVTPNQGGATNWFPPSFSPQTGLFYVNATRAFSVWYIYDASDNPMGWGGTDRGGYAEQPQLKAIDYKTGKIRWTIAALRRQLRHPDDRGQRAVQRRRRRHRRLQRDDRRAAVERAGGQLGDQRPHHLRARRPAVRGGWRRGAHGRLRPESMTHPGRGPARRRRVSEPSCRSPRSCRSPPGSRRHGRNRRRSSPRSACAATPSDKIVEGRRYRTQWDQVLEQMVARGATGTDAEFDVIFDYLVSQYGRVAINTAPADEIAQVLHLEQDVADTIVQQRKAGPFADFEALTKVPGVPVAELEKRRDAIVF